MLLELVGRVMRSATSMLGQAQGAQHAERLVCTSSHWGQVLWHPSKEFMAPQGATEPWLIIRQTLCFIFQEL